MFKIAAIHPRLPGQLHHAGSGTHDPVAPGLFGLIQRDIGLPEDTIASVRTRGLIGDKYISLSPGASDRMIPAGGKIRETEGALDLEGLIGEFIHGSAKK